MTYTQLNHIHGDTFDYAITVSDDSGAIDLTGSTIKLSIKESESSTAYLVQATATLDDPVNGLASFYIEASTMEAVTVGTRKYDIEWTDASGKKETILIGNFVVVQDITRPAL